MVTDLGSEDLENLMLRLEQARWAAQSISRDPWASGGPRNWPGGSTCLAGAPGRCRTDTSA